MADVCDDADLHAQPILDAQIAQARARSAEMARLAAVRYEVCQYCGEATVDGLPYCDDACHKDAVREAEIRAKQFAQR